MLLAVILVAAVTRPRWLPEAAVAVPAAIVVIVTGVLPLTAARAETGPACTRWWGSWPPCWCWASCVSPKGCSPRPAPGWPGEAQ